MIEVFIIIFGGFCCFCVSFTHNRISIHFSKFIAIILIIVIVTYNK